MSSAPGVPRAAYPHVVGWMVCGLVVLTIGLVTQAPWPAVRLGPDWVLAAVALASVVLSMTTVQLPVAMRTTSDVTLSEAALLPAVVLLHPGWAIALAVLGEVTAELRARKHPAKVAFNAGWTAVAAGAAAVAFQLFWSGDLTSPTMASATLTAAAAYTTVNLVALYTLASATSGERLTTVASRTLVEHVTQSLGVACIGIVAAVILITTPWLLPLLGVPLLLARSRAMTRQQFQSGLLDERDRFDRTIAGASDGIVLVDGGGRVRVWNSAAEAVVGTPASEALGRPAVDTLPLMDLRGRDIDLVGQLHEARNAYGPTTFPAVVRTSGRAVELRLSSDAAGEELVLVFRDITRQHELEQMREDLVSRVSHELRTPLATTAGFLETALGRWEQLDDPRRRELIGIAHRSSRRLSRIVAGLLVRSRIEGGATTPHPRIVDVHTLVDGVVGELGTGIGLPTRITCRPSVPPAYADPEHVAQIIEQLVVNADRYGAERIDITISGADQVVLEVADRGPGVRPEFLPHLFDAFSQASVGLRRTAEGLGMGLSIAHALVEANGGRITYDDAPGGGAVFRVRLPAAPGRSHVEVVQHAVT